MLCPSAARVSRSSPKWVTARPIKRVQATAPYGTLCGRGVQVDPHAVRVAEQGVALAPVRVPWLLLAFKACRDDACVDLVDLGGARALECERHLIAVDPRP